jgi:hypothetical protein
MGKFNDFTTKAKGNWDLGVNYIWYTGSTPCLIRDYTAIGVSNDDPDVVKEGRVHPCRKRLL